MDEQEKLKQIPIITMLAAAAVTAVISLFSEITFGMFLLRIFVASIAFYLIGSVVQILFTYALKNEVKVEAKSGTVEDGDEPAKESESSGEYPDEEDEDDEGF